jgi:uncharacterized protein (TIGR00304 family)
LKSSQQFGVRNLLSVVGLAIILFILAFVVIFIGMLLIILGTLRESFKKSREGEERVRGGAVIVVGPLPIVIGTDRESAKILMILAIALTVVAVLVFILLNWGGALQFTSRVPTR